MITYDNTCESFQSHIPMMVIMYASICSGVRCTVPTCCHQFWYDDDTWDSIPSTVRIKTPATTLLSRIGLVVVGAGVIIGYYCNVLYDEHIYIRNTVMTL